MEYGLIFHVTRIGGNFRGIWADTRTGTYYCKNMKYRINMYIYVVTKKKFETHFNGQFTFQTLAVDFSSNLWTSCTTAHSRNAFLLSKL